MLISLTAPSGGGKEFLKKALLQRFPGLKELCWTTTRLLRHRGEIQGVTRESVSHTEFDALEKAGELAFVQSLVGGRYGIRRGFLERTSGHFLTEFHIDNLIATSRAGHSPVAIALIPRDIAFLEERLARRGTRSARTAASSYSLWNSQRTTSTQS
ncbi:MAG: hypothetical protein NT077_00980 [Candidatus Taylorbacteria bacterium]|nr:hypothetical protein [Candidatus Taylorbacteria bacterium]